MIEVVILKTGEDMKKLILLGITAFLCACSNASREKIEMTEKDAHLLIQVEHQAYADKLNDLWNRSYPKQKDALHFVVQPYYFTQDIKQDIIWTNDIDATFLKDKLMEIKEVSYTYDVPNSLQRKELSDYYTPVIGEGLVFCYRKAMLEKNKLSEEDLVSFEQMAESHVRYYHNHMGEYVYPFFAKLLPEETIPFTNLFPKEQTIKQLKAYKEINTKLDMPDDLIQQKDFYNGDDYLCGLLSTKFQYEKRGAYQNGNLHFMAMPSWQEETIAPPFTTFGFAVTKECKYPNTARRFLAMVRSKKGIQALLDTNMKVPLLCSEDVKDFDIYDHAKKELIEAVNTTQLYNLSIIEENPGITMEMLINQSDFTSILQNYICSKDSAAKVYKELVKNLRTWSIGK